MACFNGTELSANASKEAKAITQHLKITKYEETGHVTKGFLYHFRPRFDLLFLSRQRI